MTTTERPKKPNRNRRRHAEYAQPQFFGSKPMKISRQDLPHCCKADTMHICLGAGSEDTQKTCHFRFPSSGGARCMDLRFEEYCTNSILHSYLRGTITDSHASIQIGSQKKKLTKINNLLEGYTIDFPLEGEETNRDLEKIYRQLETIGINKPAFWVDAHGKSGIEYEYLNITPDDILDGKWCPKDKKYLKDIIRYIKLRNRLL